MAKHELVFEMHFFKKNNILYYCQKQQQSPIFLAPGTSFMKDYFSAD